VEYRLPFGEVAFYEGALFDLFQKYRPSPSLVSVTIHKASGGAYTVLHAWPPDDRSAANIAEFITRKIWEAYAAYAGHVFDGVTVEFSTFG
jgi:hypothetical protein